MDLNLQYWNEGQSFFQRFLQWVDLLDPTVLLSSKAEILNSRTFLQNYGQTLKIPDEDKKVKEAWKLSLTSVHPDTGNILPTVFRPPALLPIVAPLAIATLIPHKGVKPALFWQLLFQSYTAGFNFANGNASFKEGKNPVKQIFFVFGAVSYTACMGIIPQIMMNRYKLNSPLMQTFLRKIVPVPLFACLSAFNVAAVRASDLENGIEVLDKNGNVVGVSQKAGRKAVEETALSRGVLMGTVAAIPELLISLLRRTQFLRLSPFAQAPIRHMITALVLGLMMPVSFSLFQPTGKIQREKLELNIQSVTQETELYYNRGL
ncbi:sideroflexin-4 isoform X1 [Latimeria chalumnae]|uniref:Sideroflexin 4 n=1 Tax=Latimeria chalumnae TaxID=7897 RepID=H3B4C0_LATCH|nr:PREDICTED: sideroflexin-4 [Latimeria chalumnae]|eukprot:XP_005999277.1 PREDICTED: sideroflexin-4 [Latimeria chalumnae]